jgi:catechol 2,3-dioxygenase-like lactoylglutathione lyase family enzyme
MGHVLVMAQNVTAALEFYRDLLGFRISDYMREPLTAYFLHINPRHHSLALVQAPVNAMNHLMVELYSLDDVGQGYDIALMNREQIAATLGRHNNDLITSFYMRTPSDFLVEYGWDGRVRQSARSFAHRQDRP